MALGHVEERFPQQPRAVAVPRPDGAVETLFVSSGITLAGVHRPALAQAVAGGAGALGAVERERARRQLGHGDVAAGAGERAG